jgi:hypothetical protein
LSVLSTHTNEIPSNPLGTGLPSAGLRESRRIAQLENRRCIRIDVTIHGSHLIADVAARIAGKGADFSRAVEPAQSRKSDRPRIASHQERRVRRPGDGGEARGHDVDHPSGFLAESREGGKRSAGEGRVECISTRAVGEQDDDGHVESRRSWWRFRKVASVLSCLNPTKIHA